jgi:hypothetical protein
MDLITQRSQQASPEDPANHVGQTFNLITVSVHGTLLYFISLISDKISHT